MGIKIVGIEEFDPPFGSPVSGKMGGGYDDPRSGGTRKHLGGDIFAAPGTPVVAPGNMQFLTGKQGGTNLRGNDWWSWWRDTDTGIEYRFAHHGPINQYKPGQTVSKGEPFAEIGSAIKDPHVHFSVVNPQTGKAINWSNAAGLNRGMYIEAGSLAGLMPSEKLAGKIAGLAPNVNIDEFDPPDLSSFDAPQAPEAPTTPPAAGMATIGEGRQYPGIMGMQDTPPAFMEKRPRTSADIPENLQPLNVLKKVLTPPSIEEINRGMFDVFQPGGLDRLNEKAAAQLASPEAAVFAALDPMVAVAGLGGIKETMPVTQVTSPQVQALSKVVTGVGEKYNPNEIKKLISVAKNEFGIDLTVPELTNSPTLRALWTRLAKTPGPQSEKLANYIQEVRNPQVAAAIEQELKNISPSSMTGWQTGGAGRIAAQNIEESLKGVRKTATKPMYKEAFENAQPVNIEPILYDVTQALEKYPIGHPSRSALEKVEQMLSKVDTEKLPPRLKTEDIGEIYNRAKLIKEFGGFNPNSAVLKGFPPNERKALYPYMKKGAQGPDELLDELRGNYPHLFNEFADEYDFLKAIVDKRMNRSVDLDKIYAEMERKAIESPDRYSWDFDNVAAATGEKIPITDLETLHHAKTGIDRLLDMAKREGSIDNDTRRLLTGIKAKLTGVMERDNPLYGEAQQTFRLLSKPLNDFRYGTPNLQPRDPHIKTVIARVADLGAEEIEKVPGIVFNAKPGQIARTRQYFDQAYPGTWDAIVKSHIENKLNRIKETVIEREGNVGGAFKRAVFNDVADKEKLRAALPPDKYFRLEQFMNVLDKTRRIIYTNSDTAFQIEAGKILEQGGATEIIKNIPTSKIGVVKWVASQFDKVSNPMFAGKLADAMLNGQNALEISKLAKLPNSPEKALKTAVFIENVTMKGGTTYENK